MLKENYFHNFNYENNQSIKRLSRRLQKLCKRTTWKLTLKKNKIFTRRFRSGFKMAGKKINVLLKIDTSVEIIQSEERGKKLKKIE